MPILNPNNGLGSSGNTQSILCENIEDRNNKELVDFQEYLVIDAFDDPDVNDHVAARYIYIEETDSFLKLVTYSQINVIYDYNKLINKPESTVEDIDETVNTRHLHNNKVVLDKINDLDNNLQYNGKELSGSFGLTFGPNLKIKCISGEALNEFDPVYMDFNGLVKKCDNTNLDTAFRFCGINLTSVAASGEEVEVVVSGTVENSAYDFGDPTDPANTKRSTPLWIGVNKLTQTEPTIGFACIVAIPVGQHKILINKQFPIFI